jgi:probable phosphoglycerate mutase
MITTMVAVRHGETEWNKIERQQGHLNSPLTALGKQQARAMAEGLKLFRFDHFYSSDLGRAVETAAVISRVLGLTFETDARLRERHLGVLQGLTWAEFSEEYPADFEKYHGPDPHGPDPDYRLGGGESVRDRFTRNVACLEELAAKHPGKTILVVCHGGVLRSFMDRALDIPLGKKRAYALPNAAINVFTISETNEWRLESWGETGHLRLAGLSARDDN